jgi:hypothetical protein
MENATQLKTIVSNWIISTNPSCLTDIMDKWILIGEFEFKFCMAFGCERINLLYRSPNTVLNTYPILYTTDYDDIIQSVKSWSNI